MQDSANNKLDIFPTTSSAAIHAGRRCFAFRMPLWSRPAGFFLLSDAKNQAKYQISWWFFAWHKIAFIIKLMRINYPISFVFKHIKLSANPGCINWKPLMACGTESCIWTIRRNFYQWMGI